ncbi:MAG: glycosyltransferase family 1 protein [Eubacterium sp.]|nr:glycosyltransferase family 1 protein [Eubacterium sp.]
MTDKKKVLILTDKLNIGGYDIVAYNLQRNLDKEKFEVTYLVRDDKIGPLEQSAIDSGAKVIHQPKDTLSYFKSYFYLKELLKKNKYDIIHSHLMFYSGIAMKAAYKCKVPKRVSHSHFTDPCIQNRSKLKIFIASVYHTVMRLWIRKYATDYIGCGPEAGEYLFGKKLFNKKGILLNNGIYTDEFSFETDKRDKVRNEFNLEDKLVLGHVGHLNYIKNHKFLVDVFYEFQKSHPDSVLLIVGDGEQRANIESKSKELGIDDKVIITGIRTDVDELLCAMDCFVFPSLKEGFPLTLVEAQATKLPCVISDSVTKSAKLNSNIEYLPLNEKTKIWTDTIYQLIQIDRATIDNSKLIDEFDIKICAKKLEKIYLS